MLRRFTRDIRVIEPFEEMYLAKLSCKEIGKLLKVSRTIVAKRLRKGGSLRVLGSSSVKKTHCKQGHLFDTENTYIRPITGRGCKICRREAYRRFKLANT